MSNTAVKRLLADRRLWLMAAYGFVAGLPLPLSGFTFRLWLSEGGVSLAGLSGNLGASDHDLQSVPSLGDARMVAALVPRPGETDP